MNMLKYYMKSLIKCAQVSWYFATHKGDFLSTIMPFVLRVTRQPVALTHTFNGQEIQTMFFDMNCVECFYEIFIQQQYKTNLLNIKTVVDVGANVGYFAQYIKCIYPDAKVYCYEPDATNYKRLLVNVCGVTDIYCYQYAISNKKGFIKFYESAHSMSSSVLKRPGTIKTTTVYTCPLKKLHSSIDLLKIDVEGAELEVMQGVPPVKYIIGEYHKDLVKQQFNPASFFNYASFKYVALKKTRFLFYITVA